MTFSTVVVDPPWPFGGGFNGWGARRELPYASLPVCEIEGLPIASAVAREGYVFLWATSAHLGAAFKVLDAWRLCYRQTLVWCKDEDRKGLGGMFGSCTEFVLVAQKIRPGTNAHGSRTSRHRVARNWFTWGRRGHSEKPDDFFSMVETVAPGPYLEVFARSPREGWTVCGNEVCGGEDVRDSLARITGTLPLAPASVVTPSIEEKRHAQDEDFDNA